MLKEQRSIYQWKTGKVRGSVHSASLTDAAATLQIAPSQAVPTRLHQISISEFNMLGMWFGSSVFPTRSVGVQMHSNEELWAIDKLSKDRSTKDEAVTGSATPITVILQLALQYFIF